MLGMGLKKLTEHQLDIVSTVVGAMVTTPACKKPSDSGATGSLSSDGQKSVPNKTFK